MGMLHGDADHHDAEERSGPGDGDLGQLYRQSANTVHRIGMRQMQKVHRSGRTQYDREDMSQGLAAVRGEQGIHRHSEQGDCDPVDDAQQSRQARLEIGVRPRPRCGSRREITRRRSQWRRKSAVHIAAVAGHSLPHSSPLAHNKALAVSCSSQSFLVASLTADPEGAPAAAFLQIAFFLRKEKKKE